MKSRLFASIVFSISCILIVSGCSTILIRPAADNVKTVALVSVFMNRDFYDVKDPQARVILGSLKPLGSALVNGTDIPNEIADPQAKEHETLIAYAIKAYSERLDGAGNMQWQPAASVVSNNEYRKFADSYTGKRSGSKLAQTSSVLNESEWYTAKGMVHIPINKVVFNGTLVFDGNKQDMRKELAGLCKDLNVDAVAILEFDMAFKKTLLNLDFIGGIPAIPSISAALVLVNRNGEIAANSGTITKGQGRRFEGKNVGMLKQNNVILDSKSIDSYFLAIDKSADDIKKRMEKDFSKMH